MALNVGKEIIQLQKLTVPELRRRYTEVCGEDITSRNRNHLIRRIIWQMQVQEEGGLSERARRRALELAINSDVRLTAPKTYPAENGGITKEMLAPVFKDERLPMPGTILMRQYKGESIQVRVLPNGFDYEGEVYRTLSAVAKKVTGTHWNGYHFFKLGGKGSVDDQKQG
jgi:hypothetical protein